MKLCWKGCVLDPSGYGNANRDFVKSLHMLNVDIKVDPWNFEQKPAETYGADGALMKKLMVDGKKYDTVMHHYVPNNVEPRFEIGKKNFGYSTWETDRIPEHWVEQINKMFIKQIVPSEYNKEAYINSGVTIPVEVVPHCFDWKAFAEAEPLELGSDLDDKFKILSVFQWIERKNPIGLLKAYYTGFYGNEDVVLIIKSYGMNTSKQEQERLAYYIQAIKKELQLDPEKCPKVLFIGDLFSREQMLSLYAACDCFALPSKSEGFGMPYAEACASGMVIVAPDFGGQRDFLLGEFSILTEAQPTPVAHMHFPYYTGLMTWCEPDLIDFRNGMLEWYNMWKNSPA